MQKRFCLPAALILMAFAGPVRAEIRHVPATCPFPADVALRIEGAKGEVDGVDSEYQWLVRERPGWRRTDQSTAEKGGHVYDILVIVKGNDKQTICFDITDFFGKF